AGRFRQHLLPRRGGFGGRRITLGEITTKRVDVVEAVKLHCESLVGAARLDRFPGNATMNEWLDDFKTAVAFLTRLPMPHPLGPMPPNFMRAHRMFPVVGALIGAAIGLFCLALRAIGLPDLAAAALALGDGAAGFGGGRDTAAKLEIMRDSRLGTYGALILLVSFAAKLSALAALPDAQVVYAMIAAHALARGALPVMALNLPYARKDGL